MHVYKASFICNVCKTVIEVHIFWMCGILGTTTFWGWDLTKWNSHDGFSPLDGDTEADRHCCYRRLSLCHTHLLWLFLWAGSSSRQSRSGVAEYQCTEIMLLLDSKDFKKHICSASYSPKKKNKKANLSSAPRIYFSSHWCKFSISTDTQDTFFFFWSLSQRVSWVHGDTIPSALRSRRSQSSRAAF